MSSTVFALLLFGCSDDGSACQRLAAQPKYYDSQVMCEADVDFALSSEVSLRADYPSVVAKCVPAKEIATREPTLGSASDEPGNTLSNSRFDPIYRVSR